MTTAVLTENYCLDATVTAKQLVTLNFDYVRQIYASGGAGEDEPAKDLLLDYRPERPFRTRKMAFACMVVFDFGEAKAIRLLAAIAHNLTPAGCILFELSTAADFSTIADSRLVRPTAGRHSDIVVLPAEVTARYLRVWALDMTLDWLEIGVVIAGDPTVLDRGVVVGAEDTYNDQTIQTRTPGGGMMVAARRPFVDTSLPIEPVGQAEKEAFYTTLGEDNGRRIPILVLRNWTTAAVAYAGWWIYGLLTRSVAHQSIHPSTWRIVLEVTELRGRPSAGIVTQNRSIAVDPLAVDFADTQVGASTDGTVTVTNAAASTGPLTGLVSVAGSGFSIVGSASYNLVPGASKAFTVRFAPSTTGEKATTLSVSHGAFNQSNPVQVALTGTATAPPSYAILALGGTNPQITLSNGNLTATMNATPALAVGTSTNGPADFDVGKFYVEVEIDVITGSSAEISIGVRDTNQPISGDLGDGTYSYAWRADGYKENAGSTSALGSSANAGDIVMLAIEALDAEGHANIWFGLNGTWFGSGDPATGANPAFANVLAGLATDWVLSATMKTTGTSIICNFGASAFSYTVPAGFGAGWGWNLG